MLICLAVPRKIIGNLSTRRSWYHERQPEVFLQHDSHCACEEVLEPRSRTSKCEFSGWNQKFKFWVLWRVFVIQKWKFFVWNHVFFVRKKQNLTQIFKRHFYLNDSVGVRHGFTLFCLMICIWHANRVPDPVPCGQLCRTWIKNVWCLSSLMTIPRTFMMYLHQINSLESVNDVVYNSVKIFFTGILFVYRECVSVKAFNREKNISKIYLWIHVPPG